MNKTYNYKDKPLRYNQMTTETFVAKAKLVHGDFYDYSLVDYERSCIKVKIICPKHGVFEQTPNNHIMGMRCEKCTNEENGLKRRLTTQVFIDRAHGVHGDKYDYSGVVYVGNDVKVKIVCPIHGPFMQAPYSHLGNAKTKGKGCPVCGRWSLLTLEDFIKRSEEIHGLERYDYSQIVYVNCRTKVKIICPKHGVFEQRPQSHLKGSGCDLCKESQGEIKIKNFLDRNNIPYERERSFEGCRNKNPLQFDFYVPHLNTCIEYDGSQHFNPVEFFGGEVIFKETQKSDSIKNNFCLDKGIKLIRISYKKKTEEAIEAVLRQELFQTALLVP